MNNYYFTFGQDHRNIDCVPMKDWYIKVVASSYESARTIFIDQYAIPLMGRADKWAFQYDDTNFKPEYYPLGELKCIVEH